MSVIHLRLFLNKDTERESVRAKNNVSHPFLCWCLCFSAHGHTLLFPLPLSLSLLKKAIFFFSRFLSTQTLSRTLSLTHTLTHTQSILSIAFIPHFTTLTHSRADTLPYYFFFTVILTLSLLLPDLLSPSPESTYLQCHLLAHRDGAQWGHTGHQSGQAPLLPTARQSLTLLHQTQGPLKRCPCTASAWPPLITHTTRTFIDTHRTISTKHPIAIVIATTTQYPISTTSTTVTNGYLKANGHSSIQESLRGNNSSTSSNSN